MKEATEMFKSNCKKLVFEVNQAAFLSIPCLSLQRHHYKSRPVQKGNLECSNINNINHCVVQK